MKCVSRQGLIFVSFAAYHITKSILWRRGYFAKFFYRQRFLSFPLLFAAMYYNLKKGYADMRDAEVLEYNFKRLKFERDSNMVEKVLKNRTNLLKDKETGKENTVKITELINDIKKS